MARPIHTPVGFNTFLGGPIQMQEVLQTPPPPPPTHTHPGYRQFTEQSIAILCIFSEPTSRPACNVRPSQSLGLATL